ncbi:hypothetical protein FACS189427_03760 [Planctomycetales bacterium]|nr:hypothetical protein FACS189427_03760 [Planctomycetales bacterium]
MPVNSVVNNDNTIAALTQTFTEVAGRTQEARIAGANSFLAMLETSRKQNEEQRLVQKNAEKQSIENEIIQHKTLQHNELQTRSIRQDGLSENYQQRLNRSENIHSDYREQTETRKEENALQNREVSKILPVFSSGNYPSLPSASLQTSGSIPQTGQLPVNNGMVSNFSTLSSGILQGQIAASAVQIADMHNPALPPILPNSALQNLAQQNLALSNPVPINPAVNVFDRPVNQAAVTSLITVFTASGRFLNGNAVREKEKQDDIKAADKKIKSKEDSKAEGGGTAKRVSSSFGAAVFGKFNRQEIDTANAAQASYSPQTENGEESLNETKEPSAGIKLPPLFKEVKSEEDVPEKMPEYLKELALGALQQAAEKTVEIKTAANSGIETQTADTEAAGTQTSEQYERVMFVKRIAAACQSAAQQSGTVRFRLNVGNDETLKLVVRTIVQKSGNKKENSEIAVRFETTSETTAGFLSGSIDSLITTLAEQGTVLTKQGIEIVCTK